MISIDILTIFPDMFSGIVHESILKRAMEKGDVSICVHNLRKWSTDQKHGKVDDPPYGGGPGMIMMVEPVARALDELKKEDSFVILPSPRGKIFTQEHAALLSQKAHIIFICAHYEGIDQRVSDYLADIEFSVGEFILTGGEIPAMAMLDATVRLVPGVLGNADSLVQESFTNIPDSGKKYIEYPQYTRPSTYRGWRVPEVLLSGNHKLIQEWREKNKIVLS